jgi:hypothetical protein
MFNRETPQETEKRLLKLTNIKNDPDVAPYIEPQVALDELCRFFLGEDWYVTDPLSTKQVNYWIVYDIERKFKNKCIKKGKHFKSS